MQKLLHRKLLLQPLPKYDSIYCSLSKLLNVLMLPIPSQYPLLDLQELTQTNDETNVFRKMANRVSGKIGLTTNMKIL